MQIIGIAIALISPLIAYAFKQDKELDRLRLKSKVLEDKQRDDFQNSIKRINEVENNGHSNFSDLKALLADLSKEVREEHKRLTNSITRLTVTLEQFTRDIQDQKEYSNQRFSMLEQDVRTKGKD